HGERAKTFARQVERPTDVAAGVVVLARRIVYRTEFSRLGVFNNVAGVGAVIGAEAMVARVIVDRAVEGAGSALGRRVDQDRGRPVFGGVVAGLDFDLLHHVRVGGDDAAVVGADVHHSRAVNLHVVVLAAQTVDVVISAAVGSGHEADLLQLKLLG